jgi:hypothetical protein
MNYLKKISRIMKIILKGKMFKEIRHREIKNMGMREINQLKE